MSEYLIKIAMKSDTKKFWLCVLFFVVLAVITFRCTWPVDHVFSASDMNFGRLAQSKNISPEVLTGYFTSGPVLGSSRSAFKLLTLMFSVMPVTVFINSFFGIFLVFSSVSMVWFLRIWQRSWLSAVFGALIAFWVNSVMLSVAGHSMKMEVLALSTLSLCLIEKAVRSATIRKTVGFSILAGLAVGVTLIEQQDVALLAGLFVGFYTLFRLIQRHGKAGSRWASLLIPLGATALLLSGDTMLESYEENIVKASSVRGDADEKWNFITQWSAVPEEWPDLIAIGWGGWTSNHPEAPYWGKLGQSAEWESSGQGFRNFRLNGNYFGIIPFILGAFGLVAALKNRRSEEGGVVLFWCVAGFLGFWLAFGKYSLLYKLFYHLPLVGNIRAPIKLLDNFQVCLGIVAAYGLDYLILNGKSGKSAKILWMAGALLGGVMILSGLKYLAFPSDQLTKFSEMGYEAYSGQLVRNMSNAWFHAGLFTILCSGFIFFIWKGLNGAKWVPLAFVGLIVADSLVFTTPNFTANDISSLKKGNVVINYLKANQGHERTFFMDQSGIYNQWLASDGPYHDLNLFNIWQMSRMHGDYKEFLGTVGRNQMRLWELASVKYIAAPAEIMQQLSKNPKIGQLFNSVLNYQIPTNQGMRNDMLLEFKGAIPRLALYQGWQSLPMDQQCKTLADPSHNPRTTILLDSAEEHADQIPIEGFIPLNAQITKRRAIMDVQVQNPSIIRFSQHYQPGWKVYVDGEQSELLKVDYLCMGVLVQPGNHHVEFHCVNGTSRAVSVSVVFVSALLIAAWLLNSIPMKRRT